MTSLRWKDRLICFWKNRVKIGWYRVFVKVGGLVIMEATRLYWYPTLGEQMNQCDGCRAGKPVDEKGNHVMSESTINHGGYMFQWRDLMGCTKDRYKEAHCAACGITLINPAVQGDFCGDCS